MNTVNRIIKIFSSEGKAADAFRGGIILLLLAAAAYPAALLTWKAIPAGREAGKTLDSRQDLQIPGPKGTEKSVQSGIVPYPLFGEARPEKKAETAPSPSPENIPKSTLQLVLKGVIGASNQARALAIINSRDGKSEDGIYGVGDSLPGNAVLKDIYSDRVVLRRAGKLETLLLDESEDDNVQRGGASRIASVNDQVVSRGDGVHWKIKKNYLNRQLSDIPALAKDVGLDIYKEGNVQKGYRIISSRGSPLLKNLGLQPGDALLEVNGIKLVDAHRGLTAYQKIRDASEVRITVNRNGVRKNFVYSID